MPYNGSGVFQRIYSWVSDASNGIPITASRMDADTNDIVNNGLDNALTRDGQGTPTANLPMAGFRHTGASNAVNPGDYVTLGQAGTAAGQTGWKSFVIGGDFSTSPWQYGTSFTLNGTKQYTADRFAAIRPGGGYTISRTTFVDSGYAAKMLCQRSPGDSSASPATIICDLPSDLSSTLAGRSVTISIMGILLANFSGTLVINVFTGTGQNQTLFSGYTGQANIGSLNLATGWSTSAPTALNFTAVIPQTISQIGISITHTPSGTAGSNDAFRIYQVQIEPNANFTGFERRPPELEKLMCQQFALALPSGTTYAGQCASTSGVQISIPLPTTMFRAPTSLGAPNGNFFNVFSGSIAPLVTAFSLAFSTTNSVLVNVQPAASVVVGNGAILLAGNNNGMIISCEL